MSRPQAVKFRAQRVKFRRRYATSRASEIAHTMGVFVKIAAVASVITFAVMKSRQFWATSDWVRVSAVETTGDATPALAANLGLKPGINLVTLPVAELEKKALSTHKEYASVSVSRQWDRSVSVSAAYRDGLASFEGSDGKKGFDAAGIVFIRPEGAPAIEGPIVTGDPTGMDFRSVSGGLAALKNDFPNFYSRVKFLKTDRILPLRLILDNDVVVVWGDFNPSSVPVRVARVKQVLDNFLPKKPFAALLFVTDDRIVMDAQWKEK